MSNLTSVERPGARKRELAQIHIAIGALRWDDDHYRAVLFAKTGKRSAGELDSTGRKRFIEHLKACGWSGGKSAAAPRFTRQQWHVRMLWRDLGRAGALSDRSDEALDAFVKGLVGIDSLRFLVNVSDASRVIEALKAWLRRTTQAGVG